jgi:ubiquinone/menaquinone biosynthesis C-methylase UbiE
VSFDSIAPYYRWIETIVFGNALQRARIYWIDAIPHPKRALIVGEGNGRFLCELLRVHPKIDIDCIDASERMLQLTRSRVRRTHPESLAHVRFFHQNILNWSPRHSYDLLVTHFLLDCFESEKLELIVAKLAETARQNAVWLIADFTLPKEHFARAHATLWLRVMYAFFRLTARIKAKKLVDPTPYLEANGFIRTSMKLSRWRMLRADVYAAAISSGNPATEMASKSFQSRSQRETPTHPRRSPEKRRGEMACPYTGFESS